MTPEEVDSMPAGRELDLLVAGVLDLDVHIRCPHCDGWEQETTEEMAGWNRPHKIRCDRVSRVGDRDYICDWRYQGCPLYSSELGAIGPLLQYLLQRGDLFIEFWRDGEWFLCNRDLLMRKENIEGTWMARSDKVDEDSMPNLPLALCRAVLKASL